MQYTLQIEKDNEKQQVIGLFTFLGTYEEILHLSQILTRYSHYLSYQFPMEKQYKKITEETTDEEEKPLTHCKLSFQLILTQEHIKELVSVLHTIGDYTVTVAGINANIERQIKKG